MVYSIKMGENSQVILYVYIGLSQMKNSQIIINIEWFFLFLVERDIIPKKATLTNSQLIS
jgi:hypothetical protein